MEQLAIVILLVSAILLTVLVSGIWFTRKTRRKVSYMLDALEDNETNFKFKEEGVWERKFNRTLNRMKIIYEKERDKILEQETFFGKMLDNVQTGIVVVDNVGQVFYSNHAAREILGVLTLMNIRQLANIGPELAEAFSKVVEGHSEKAAFINNMSRMTISLEASSADMAGRKLKIISINDISEEMEKSESMAWTKLIRVLTHEIMNTVTPISSLSDSLVQITGAGASPELKEGLETISASTKSLINFVESYRSLTRIPQPVKKVLYLRDVAAGVINLMETPLAGVGGTCTYREAQAGTMIYADEGQIRQIMVNIIKNALQAGATDIRISVRVDAAESVIVDIANNGMPVSKESMDEIFVPFYSTKPSGSGIGLSLSRQIMHMHNGNLLLTKSNEKETVFTMIFK